MDEVHQDDKARSIQVRGLRLYEGNGSEWFSYQELPWRQSSEKTRREIMTKSIGDHEDVYNYNVEVVVKRNHEKKKSTFNVKVKGDGNLF